MMGGEHYALPVGDVSEVADIGELTPLPGAPRPFLGIRNLRGEVLPVIDLAGALAIEAAGEPRRIVVAQAGALRAGLAVESVEGVLELTGPQLPTEAPALKGAALVDDTLVGIVDVPRLLLALSGTPTP